MRAKSLNDILHKTKRLMRFNKENAIVLSRNYADRIVLAAQSARINRGLSKFSKNRDEKK